MGMLDGMIEKEVKKVDLDGDKIPDYQEFEAMHKKAEHGVTAVVAAFDHDKTEAAFKDFSGSFAALGNAVNKEHLSKAFDLPKFIAGWKAKDLKQVSESVNFTELMGSVEPEAFLAFVAGFYSGATELQGAVDKEHAIAGLLEVKAAAEEAKQYVQDVAEKQSKKK